MGKMSRIIFALFGLTILLLVYQCRQPERKIGEDELILKWIKNHPDEKAKDVRTGLLWAFAFAGALLPEADIDKAIDNANDSTFIINVSYLGFDGNAIEQWKKIIDYTKQTDEYKVYGSVDVGRFLMFSIYSSWHYYAITGAPDSLSMIMENPVDDQSLEAVPIFKSCVAKGLRMIKYDGKGDILNRRFVAMEGNGSIEGNNFSTEVFETLTVMKNGQMRYAIYDKLGKLMDASPKQFGEAGKPAKCLWCHGGNLSPLFTTTPDHDGYKKATVFTAEMKELNAMLAEYRKTLNTALDYSKHVEHKLSRFLYIGFMEPSAKRLSQEWHITEKQVEEKLKGIATHVNEEYPFLGNLYNRSDVAKFSSFKSLPVPLSAREPNNEEPNIFK
jgi:hypothetical protein